MISGVTAPATAPDLVAGIFVAGVANSTTHLFYNSISLTGDRGVLATQVGSFGVAMTGTDPVVELKDNIFYNTQTSGGGVNARTYAIGTASTTFANLSSDFNDFFTSGANAAGFRTGGLNPGGAGVDLPNLLAWRAATLNDLNSISSDPLFVNSTNDLHIQAASPVKDVGTPIASVTIDFDGQTRPQGAAVDIGADEFLAPTAATVSVSGRVLTGDGAGLRNAVVTLTDMSGRVRTTTTSAFGYFSFKGIELGTNFLDVHSKRFQYRSRVVDIKDQIADLELYPGQ